MTFPPAADSASLVTQARSLYTHLKDNGVLDSAKSAHKLHQAATSLPSAAGSAGAVALVVQSVTSYHTVQAQETTKRQQIAADLQRDLAQLDLVRAALSNYLTRTFDERKSNFDQLFTVLDVAQAQGDHAGMKLALDGLLTLAQSSPFKDLNEIRRLSQTSDFVLEL
jgi:hypothetical protein